MKQFWALFEKSIITQSIITIGVMGTAMYLYASGNELPKGLEYILFVIIGFFFGSKVGYNQGQSVIYPNKGE